ncbi:xanthine dehydrogenase accessory protein XdhC, partial [Roseateles sp. GG27B]
AWMAVLPAALIGTIGGGQLEFEAISQAKALLADAHLSLSQPRRFALGPSLGQCCGGVVDLTFERLSARPGLPEQSALRQRLAVAADQLLQVALFVGGHVGRAIVRLLATLPARVCWIDSRDEVFPADLPDKVQTEYSDPVQAAVHDLAAGAHVLIMSFSHAEDLDVVAACLLRQRLLGDLPYVGLIGSKSKWATFRQRLEARGFSALELAHITSPIGVAGIAGKQPEVIAVAVAAQLLQQPGWLRR